MAQPIWSRIAGWETGTVTSLCIPALAAWCFVYWNRQQRTTKSGNTKNDTVKIPGNSTFRLLKLKGWRSFADHAFRFFLATILSCIAALSLLVALTRLFNLYIETAMAMTVLMLPFVWGLAAWWSTSDDNSWHPALGLFGISLICSVIALV